MNEIPHDIREAAAKALNEAEAMIGTLFSDRLEVVAKVILAERERCALVAEGHRDSRPLIARQPSSLVIGRYEGEQAACTEVARLIRTPTNAFGGELPEIDGLRWLRPGGLMPNVIRAETAAGDYYITNGDRIAISGPLSGHFDTVEDAVAAVVRHHAASVSSGADEACRGEHQEVLDAIQSHNSGEEE